MIHVRTPQSLLIACIVLTMAGCLKQELQTGLTEQEAQEIIVLLKLHGLDSNRERDLEAGDKGPPLYRVTVKGGDQNLVLAWRILQENGLPRQKVKGLEEVYSQTGLIPTASEEKGKMLIAHSGEISRTLEGIPGIVSARVHVVLPENSPIIDKADWKPTTASVLLKYMWPQPPIGEEDVRNLVAKAVEGLTTDNVAVVYHKIEPRTEPSRTVAWYLGNQQYLLASLVLLTVSSLGNLALTVRGRQQRLTIDRLHKDLRRTLKAPQLPTESIGNK